VHFGNSFPGLDKAVKDSGLTRPKVWYKKLAGKDLLAAMRLWKAARADHPDIVYHRFAKSSIILPLIAKVSGCKLILELNADLRGDLAVGDLSAFKKHICFLCERINVLLSNHVVVVSEGIRNAVVKAYKVPGEKVTVIHNGTDIDMYSPLDKNTCRRSLGLDEHRKYVVFAGTFQPWQGLAVLLDAVPTVLEKESDVQFILAGDGTEREALAERVSELGVQQSVCFAGWCDALMISKYMGASDVCVAPYNSSAAMDATQVPLDGTLMNRSPLKIYMYMSAGRPVVCADYADGGRFVEQVGAGLKFPIGDSNALAEAILELLADQEKSNLFGKNARTYAVQNCSWLSVTRKLINLYEAA
jgi:glycosyltransferase involved in cell wall biosynthesis